MAPPATAPDAGPCPPGSTGKGKGGGDGSGNDSGKNGGGCPT
jgi:hypothetical protein